MPWTIDPHRFAALALTALLGAMAPTEAPAACPRPAGLAPVAAEPVKPEEVVATTPLAFQLLAITWTPEWRRLNGQTAAFTPKLDPELRPQGFALHGLWPNGAAPPYPRYCRPGGTIAPATVRAMYCRTPSAALLQHEWQAHGTCAWSDPAAYFAQASKLYDRVRPPRIEGGRVKTAGDLRAAFAAKNRRYPRAAIFVAADRDGRLSEVRLCHDLAFRPAACPGGTGAADDRALIITPSSTGRF